MELGLKQLLTGRRASSESNLKELIRAPCLHVLFIEQVKQQVLVALNQALRVDLSMLQLLVSVTLDSLKQSTQSSLLLLSEESFLSLNQLFEVFLSGLCLFLFE